MEDKISMNYKNACTKIKWIKHVEQMREAQKNTNLWWKISWEDTICEICW
jgi:hypothetical protein